MSAPFIFTLSLYLATAIVITSSHYPKMQLVHKDELLSSNQYTNNRHHLHARVKRDSIRVVTLNRLSMNDTIVVAKTTLNLGSNVSSGLELGTGEYLVRIGVGSPPLYEYLVIDTGSDLSWIQCQPCERCFHQIDPIFDLSDSRSYADVPCNNAICNHVPNAGCHADHCSYKVSYGDRSYTEGTIALEFITFGNTGIQGVVIGCGHSNVGESFTGFAGVLGIGRGSMSFMDQLPGPVGRAFTYCLGSRGDGSGFLVFGRQEFSAGVIWMPLVFNHWAPSFYYVEVLGLGVGGTQLSVPESIFKLDERGHGGVILDTGTVVTRLPTTAYIALRDEYTRQTSNLPRISYTLSIFDTCYDLRGFGTVEVPTVSFYFKSGLVLILLSQNVLVPMEQIGIYCLAFSPSASGRTIIGNIQQKGIQISVDSSNGYVGFGPNHC